MRKRRGKAQCETLDIRLFLLLRFPCRLCRLPEPKIESIGLAEERHLSRKQPFLCANLPGAASPSSSSLPFPVCKASSSLEAAKQTELNCQPTSLIIIGSAPNRDFFGGFVWLCLSFLLLPPNLAYTSQDVGSLGRSQARDPVGSSFQVPPPPITSQVVPHLSSPSTSGVTLVVSISKTALKCALTGPLQGLPVAFGKAHASQACWTPPRLILLPPHSISTTCAHAGPCADWEPLSWLYVFIFADALSLVIPSLLHQDDSWWSFTTQNKHHLLSDAQALSWDPRLWFVLQRGVLSWEIELSWCLPVSLLISLFMDQVGTMP